MPIPELTRDVTVMGRHPFAEDLCLRLAAVLAASSPERATKSVDMLPLPLLLDDLPERLSDVSARISMFTPPNQKIIDAAETYVHYVCRTLVFFASRNAKSKHRYSCALKIIVISGIYSQKIFSCFVNA